MLLSLNINNNNSIPPGAAPKSIQRSSFYGILFIKVKSSHNFKYALEGGFILSSTNSKIP
jgi:hypothetical protein